MVELRVCPECNKAFFKGLDRGYAICSHCRYVLWDQRGEERTEGEIEASFFIEGREVPARVTDFSPSGLKVVFASLLEPLPDSAILDVNVDELGLHQPAKRVWQAKAGNKAVAAGLKLLEAKKRK